MQLKKESLSPTKLKLTLAAEQTLLDQAKNEALKRLSKNVKVAGFREGKAPLALIEKQIDQQTLQSEVLELTVNRVYADAVQENRLRPVDNPQVSVTKFVPYTELELTAEVDVVGEVKLPDYKKIKLAKPEVKVGAKDINEVIENLRERMAEKKEVSRAAKAGDEATIDFKGTDAKTEEAIAGADGTDYPLMLGSNSFIPGFEDNVVGMKPGDTKSFDLTFPKDYGVAALQNKTVTFVVTLKKVNELTKPAADDAFAAKVGSFKTLDELKKDIKTQVAAERQQEVDRQYESDLLEQIAKKTDVAIPDVLVDEEVDRQIAQLKQNLVYRGQTWEEYLKSEGVSQDEYREQQKPLAELRVTAGLALSEIAEKEDVQVTPEELELRVQQMKSQYQDQTMLAEFDKPETRREIASRILSEKTIALLATMAQT